jgi:hypothetical protein
MPLEKCECGLRMRPSFLKVHQKRCVKRIRMLRQQQRQQVTQTIDYRIDKLSEFEIDVKDYDLEKMPDVLFNDLVDKLVALKKEKENKELFLKSQKQIEDEKKEQLEIEAKEKIKKEKQRMDKEESLRLEQAKKASEYENKINDEKDKREKIVAGKLKIKPKITLEQETENNIKKIDSLIEKSIDALPKKVNDENISIPENPKKKPVKTKSKKVKE